jgi:hypothetical protein
MTRNISPAKPPGFAEDTIAQSMLHIGKSWSATFSEVLSAHVPEDSPGKKIRCSYCHRVFAMVWTVKVTLYGTALGTRVLSEACGAGEHETGKRSGAPKRRQHCKWHLSIQIFHWE